VRRYQRIDRATDAFGASWYDRFPGGCVTYRLHSTRDVEGSLAIELLTTETDDRLIHRWRRPPQFRPGWTHGPSVVVPWAPIGRHFRAVDAPAGKPVQWMPAPAPLHKVVFAILFAASDLPEPAWESIREPGDRNLGRLFLRSGESVYVAVHRAPLEPSEKAEAKKVAGELHTTVPASPRPARAIRAPPRVLALANLR
jgi:hypothetical protein